MSFRELLLDILCIYILELVVWETICPHCGWIGGEVMSIKHGGVYHFECLMEVNK